jgi:hypothetical protein
MTSMSAETRAASRIVLRRTPLLDFDRAISARQNFDHSCEKTHARLLEGRARFRRSVKVNFPAIFHRQSTFGKPLEVLSKGPAWYQISSRSQKGSGSEQI